MDEIPRDFSRDDLKMSQDQIAERDAGRARLAKLFPVADGELPDPFQVNRSLNDFKSHVTAVLSDVLAELRIMRDSTKGSLAEQVAYELRSRAGSTGGDLLRCPCVVNERPSCAAGERCFHFVPSGVAKRCSHCGQGGISATVASKTTVGSEGESTGEIPEHASRSAGAACSTGGAPLGVERVQAISKRAEEVFGPLLDKCFREVAKEPRGMMLHDIKLGREALHRDVCLAATNFAIGEAQQSATGGAPTAPISKCGCRIHASEKECVAGCECACNADFVKVERWECQIACGQLLTEDQIKNHGCELTPDQKANADLRNELRHIGMAFGNVSALDGLTLAQKAAKCVAMLAKMNAPSDLGAASRVPSDTEKPNV